MFYAALVLLAHLEDCLLCVQVICKDKQCPTSDQRVVLTWSGFKHQHMAASKVAKVPEAQSRKVHASSEQLHNRTLPLRPQDDPLMDALAFVLGCTTIAFFFHRYAPEAYMVRSTSHKLVSINLVVSHAYSADLQRLAQCQPLTLVIAFEMQRLC